MLVVPVGLMINVLTLRNQNIVYGESLLSNIMHVIIAYIVTILVTPICFGATAPCSGVVAISVAIYNKNVSCTQKMVTEMFKTSYMTRHVVCRSVVRCCGCVCRQSMYLSSVWTGPFSHD